jgi:hypothetical protein
MNDERGARDLADLLRLGRVTEAWIAPKSVRALRKLVGYRAKLVHLSTGLKAQVHAVMAKEGVLQRCPALRRNHGANHRPAHRLTKPLEPHLSAYPLRS